MKKKFTTWSFLVFVGALLFGYGTAFGGALKEFSQIIGGILVIYPLWRRFGPPVIVKFADGVFRQIPGIAVLMPPAEPTLGKASNPVNMQFLRKKVLLYTNRQIEKRIKQIENRELFITDFNITLKKDEGVWRDDRDFSVITGRAGVGKSFQMIRLVKRVCDELNDGIRNPENLENKKIPIYIELRALNEELRSSSIAEYIQQSSASFGKAQIEARLVQELIDTYNVILYFDGLDEVLEPHRERCLDAIWDFSHNIEVYVSCRKEVYDDLVERALIPIGSNVEELRVDELTPEEIVAIIDRSGYSESEKSEIKEFIGNKEKLMENLARSIILNLFLVAYPTLTVDEKQQLKTAEDKQALNILWEKCVTKLLTNEALNGADIPSMTTYMVWVAKIMRQSAFYIESIQPTWLRRIDKDGNIPEFRALEILYFLVTRITTAVIIGIALSLIISAPLAFVPNSILGGLTVWLVAGIYKRVNYHPGKRTPTWQKIAGGFVFSILLLFALMFVCGVYQGFSVPRADMTTGAFSMSETWPGIILGFVLSTMLSYRIILEKRKDRYILPVKLFHFNWQHALRYGMSWGAVSGVITGTLAVTVKRHGGNLFINNWLIPYLNDLSLKWKGTPITAANLNRDIFLYAFIFTFSIAGLLFAIFAGRYENPEEKMQDYDTEEEEAGGKRLYGIFQTLAQANKHAFRACVVTIATYGLLFYFLNLKGWDKLITCGLGIYLLAFLWYGGMEAINHAILRLTLYNKGIAPLNFAKWAQDCMKAGLISQTSYKLSFYHDSLAGYFADFSLRDNPAIRVKRKTRDLLYYWLAVGAFVVLLTAPFYLRYGIHAYWKNPYMGIQVNSAWTKKVNDSVYTIQRSGKLRLRAGGVIDVGTFVGLIRPEGTWAGFMGMSLKKAYNLPYLDTFRHSALLYRIDTANRGWSGYNYVKPELLFPVKKGDRIQVVVNDKEYQNNLFRYRLDLEFCDTCK